MSRQRLINCDFFAASGFSKNLSNKAKLLYYFFLTNADDKGFVGNGIEIAERLDQFEEIYENVLFQNKYVDALKELVDKRFTYEFSDKVGNKVYLIRHWFLHNKNQKFLTTNYISYLSKVELIDNEYCLKEEKLLKEKENKKPKLNNEEIKEDNTNEMAKIIKELENTQLPDVSDPFYDLFKGDKQ